MRRAQAFPIAITLLAAAAVLDAASAFAAWPTTPHADVPVCEAPASQFQKVSAPDGSGGVYIAWTDWRSGHYDVYAMHLLADGTPAPGWPVDGKAVAAGAGEQAYPAICADGSGGAYISWSDSSSAANYDIRVLRIDGSGAPRSGWSAAGLNVSTSLRAEIKSRLAYDGAGGVFVAWELVVTSGTNHDVRALRVRGDGTIPSPGAPGGLGVCTLVSLQQNIELLADGKGGVFLVWEDDRNALFFGWDLYAAHMTGLSALDWTSQGTPVLNSIGHQFRHTLAPDGADGLLVFWEDTRNGTYEIRGKRLGPGGQQHWSPDLLVSTAASDQFGPIAVPDGGGGAYVVWTRNIGGGNRDIYAQRVRPSGAVMWAANGVGLCTQAAWQELRAATADGEGGMIAVWADQRNTPGGTHEDLFAQRVGPGGSAGLWAFNGVPVTMTPGLRGDVDIVPDGRGGFVLSWYGSFEAIETDLMAHRIDRFGFNGDLAPVIASVTDVPNDQGGRVKVSWDASPLDVGPYYDVTEYRVWRSVPTAAALALLRSGRAVLEDDAAAMSSSARGAVRTFEVTGTTFWEHVGTQTAAGDPGYSMVVATESDSIGGSNPLTLFRVQARHDGGWAFWNSEEASGYSVDDLAPPAPMPLAAVYGSGTTALHWGIATAHDLRGYRLYAGATADFAPGPGSFVAETPDTGYVDPAPAPLHYKVTAVDVHGNESPAVLVSPPSTVGVPVRGGAFAFATPSPQPFREHVRLQWTLPEAATVRLTVFDAAGRRIARLADARFAAGTHALQWDGRDDAGRAATPGLYFARIEAGGDAAIHRVLRVR